MAKRKKESVEKYHDRVAGIYDTIYDGNAYWDTVFDITWRHMMKHISRDLSTRCLDVGCGTGRWGLRLLKGGYPTDFLDISHKMIDQVDKKLSRMKLSHEPELFETSVDDLSMIESETYGYIVGQGDPLNCARRPKRAFKELTRILKPGGMMVMSVDNRLAAIYHYFKEGDIDALKKFMKDGKTKWVTDNSQEQYEMTFFTPDNIRTMCADRGLELVSLIGKTALPLRRFQAMLKDRKDREELVRLEESLHAKESMLGCAAHLEFAARKPLDDE